MRVEPYVVGSYVHVLKRGARGLPITRDEKDKWRFVRLLYYMNDEFKDDFWERNTVDLTMFERPGTWPEQKPIVKILAWTLMPNHFHLLLQEIIEGGITKFLQKLCGSMSMSFNSKYKERGSIFQGAYKSKTVGEDRYLRWLASYIMVKNIFELYPGGLEAAANNFEKAWGWANQYKFSSFINYAQKSDSPILQKDILEEVFKESEFKSSAREIILSRTWEKGDLRTLTAE